MTFRPLGVVLERIVTTRLSCVQDTPLLTKSGFCQKFMRLRPGSLPKIGLVLPESQHCMTSNSRRLAILTTREINELYGLPCFTDEERCIYFDLSPAEHDAVDAVHTDAAAVHMVLQLGYFKAKRQVFIYCQRRFENRVNQPV